MKKYFILIGILHLVITSFSQQWAPIGSTWHYSEGFAFWNEYIDDFMKFESVKDTIVDGQNCRKIVKYGKVICNDRPAIEYMYSENGKVYFYDAYFNKFQLLYDFSAEPNDSWSIIVNDEALRSKDTLTITVDSTKLVNINGIDLKELAVTYRFIYDLNNNGNIDTIFYSSRIIENIGDIYYMFNYTPAWAWACDANFAKGLRCYEDSVIGLYETGIADSCEFRKHYLHDLMTIRETFDFEPGDVYHYRGKATDQLPNADRITITAKYYSVNEDTLYYVRHHNSYYMTYPNEYHFWQKTDTVFYTNLDSTLLYYTDLPAFSFAAHKYVSLCDSLINSFYTYEETSSPAPYDFLHEYYGRGLGITRNYKRNGTDQTIDYDNYLFYYKKSNGSCGIPDTIVSVNEIEDSPNKLILYPNPSSDYISIKLLNNHLHIDDVSIYDLSGRKISQQSSGIKISIKDLQEGIYFVKIRLDSKQTYTRKIIKN